MGEFLEHGFSRNAGRIPATAASIEGVDCVNIARGPPARALAPAPAGCKSHPIQSSGSATFASRPSMHDATFLHPHTGIDSLHPMKALLLCLTLAAASGAQSAPAVSQKEMQDTIEQLKKLQNPAPGASAVKGWVCRDMEDGGTRLYIVDRTGIARMNKVPSTEAALLDTTTPLEQLQACKRPD